MSRKKLAVANKTLTPLGERIDSLLVKEKLSSKAFAQKIGIEPAYLSKLRRKQGQGGDKFWRGIRREFPVWEPYLRGEAKMPSDLQKGETGGQPYQQEPEHMLPQKDHEAPDSGPGQMRLPQDLGKYQVVQLIRPEEGHRQRLHEKLDEILESGNAGLISAITFNIEEFARSAQKDRILETVGRKTQIPERPSGGHTTSPPEQRSPSSKPR